MLDLSHMPGDTGRDAAAFLREVWQLFPKVPDLIRDHDEKEEVPDEH
ncbi:hypothetical protein ABZY58_11400 [Micromonospora tulbaghiae]